MKDLGQRLIRKSTLLTVALLAASFLVAASASAGPGSSVVNINTASVEQLRLLPGIDQAKAEAIVSYRNNQAFVTVADLIKVRGIGTALLAKMRAQVVLQGPTTAKASKSKAKR